MSTQKQDHQAGQDIAEQTEEKALLDDLKEAQLSSLRGVWGSDEDAIWDAL